MTTPQPQGDISTNDSRAWLSFIIFGIFGVLIILSFLGVIDGHWAATKEWLNVMLPVVVGILGTVVGFYFGSKNAN